MSTPRTPLPRLAYTIDEAADVLSVSRSFFRDEVLHELRVVRRGRRKIIAATELQRWLEKESTRVLD